jgi:transposase-like protein
MNTGRHIEGSRKQKVHALYDARGPEAAFTLARKLGLKDNSARSWFSQLRRLDGDKKKVAAPKAKTKPEPKKAKAKSKAKVVKSPDAKVAAAA